MFSDDVIGLATKLLEECRQRGWQIATAESCTGGLISASLTEIAGSSDVVNRGFVTYSNEAKSDMIAVNAETIKQHGAVSEQVAAEMAAGALKVAGTDIAIAVTGVAGPGASENKPAGLVYIGIASKNQEEPLVTENHFDGTRSQVRLGTVKTALFLALSVTQKD